MKIRSFVREGWRLKPMDLEVSLVPGVPQIQFLGLPDQALRESALRIKSAIRLSGFDFPSTKQVVVNLSPPHLKKSSLGLDFPVAAAILWLTGQVPFPNGEGVSAAESRGPTLYGALGLNGSVHAPPDLDELDEPIDSDVPVWTGAGAGSVPFSIFEVAHLSQLGNGSLRRFDRAPEMKLKPPELPDLTFTRDESRLMAVAAGAEIPLLLAGPQGTGKSSMADTIARIRPDPDLPLFLEIRRIARQMNLPRPEWRPIVNPHHTSPPLGLLGGGRPVRAGEITRAHGGTLILDEYLQFGQDVQESLREPVETGGITVARAGSAVDLPAKFLLVATTNLCICGRYVPGQNSRCTCSGTRLRRVLGRLSGPMLDRFGLVYFATGDGKSERTVSAAEVKEMTLKLSERYRERNPKNFKAYDDLPPMGDRRRGHLKKVAYALGLIDGCEAPQLHHWEEALRLSFHPVEELRTAGASA